MADSVLFVDDEIEVLKSILWVFSDQNINTLVASDPDDALDIIKNNDTAVIVSDNVLPGMKGIDLLLKIKEVSPDIIRIMMTGYADLSTALEAINRCGIFKFIVKPWNNKELISTVKEALQRYDLIHSIRKSDEPTLLSLAQAVELKDRYTRGHCNRVAGYAVDIAHRLGVSEETKKQIMYGSWLHDCGKLGVPEVILNKPGPLTKDEYDIIKKHPEWGADIARQAKLSPAVVNIILYHHEWWDGCGYPYGIQGDSIPKESQIVSIADHFDALTSERPYRMKWSLPEAIGIIQSLQGRAFDPALVDIFLPLINKNHTDL